LEWGVPDVAALTALCMERFEWDSERARIELLPAAQWVAARRAVVESDVPLSRQVRLEELGVRRVAGPVIEGRAGETRSARIRMAASGLLVKRRVAAVAGVAGDGKKEDEEEEGEVEGAKEKKGKGKKKSAPRPHKRARVALAHVGVAGAAGDAGAADAARSASSSSSSSSRAV
jgi:hypothetical protein